MYKNVGKKGRRKIMGGKNTESRNKRTRKQN
jgi:hypothetical protein